MQVILDSSFARPGSAPICGGKKGEFRDWTNLTFVVRDFMTKYFCRLQLVKIGDKFFPLKLSYLLLVSYDFKALKWYYGENRFFPVKAVSGHKQIACRKNKMLFTILPAYITGNPHKQRVCLCSKYKEMYGRILKSL